MTSRDWYRMALVLGIVAILIVAMLASIVYSPEGPSAEERLAQAEVALEECRSELGECADRFEQCSADLEECLQPSTLEVEKWVKPKGTCCWQKEISVSKGVWLEFRILVTVTGTLENVRVKDPTLTGDPWVRIQGLTVDNVSVSGNIVTGIDLGTMTNETKEILFQVLLCSQDGQYRCGMNTLINTAEATADCDHRVTSSANVKVNIGCSVPPTVRTRPPRDDPDPECPEVIPPPEPPGPDGPADRPDGDCDAEPPPEPPQEGG